MELYKGKYFEVVFEDWCQEFPGSCIISGHKECLGDMTSDEWKELGVLEKELMQRWSNGDTTLSTKTVETTVEAGYQRLDNLRNIEKQLRVEYETQSRKEVENFEQSDITKVSTEPKLDLLWSKLW